MQAFVERRFFQYYLLSTKNNRQGGEYNTEKLCNPTVFLVAIYLFLTLSLDEVTLPVSFYPYEYLRYDCNASSVSPQERNKTGNFSEEFHR